MKHTHARPDNKKMLQRPRRSLGGGRSGGWGHSPWLLLHLFSRKLQGPMPEGRAQGSDFQARADFSVIVRTPPHPAMAINKNGRKLFKMQHGMGVEKCKKKTLLRHTYILAA